MHTVSSARSTCLVLKSAVECTATVLIPNSRQARRMRSAISPRLAMTTFSIMWSPLLDDAKNLPDLDFGADFHERFCAGRGGRVVRADHRRRHRIVVVARLVFARG